MCKSALKVQLCSLMFCAYAAAIPAGVSAEWRCGGFRITSPKPVTLADGEYEATLVSATQKGSCSRFNDESITLSFTKQARRLTSRIDEEGLLLRGAHPRCGGTGLTKTLRAGRNVRAEVSVLASGATEDSPETFSVLYHERQGRKTKCFRSFLQEEFLNK